MTDFDFDEIEEDLDLVVPDIYRLFIENIDNQDYDLSKHGIYANTETLLKGNWQMRMRLGDQTPKWENHYLDFGVGDGCGNYFFLLATDEEDDLVQPWAHDPPGIEDVSTGSEFLQNIFKAVADGFNGPEKFMFQGNAW